MAFFIIQTNNSENKKCINIKTVGIISGSKFIGSYVTKKDVRKLCGISIRDRHLKNERYQHPSIKLCRSSKRNQFIQIEINKRKKIK